MKLFYISLGLNIILLILAGYLIFDLGVLKAQKDIIEIQNQIGRNTQDIQMIANWLNQQIKTVDK